MAENKDDNMPAGLIRGLAKSHGVSPGTVEAAWHACKTGIKPDQGGKGYGLVVNCVKSKLSKGQRSKKRTLGRAMAGK